MLTTQWNMQSADVMGYTHTTYQPFRKYAETVMMIKKIKSLRNTNKVLLN